MSTTEDRAAAPAGWPVADLTFVEAVKRAFRQYVQFEGRASRREFWFFYLFVVGVMLVLLVPAVAVGAATSTAEDGPGPLFVVGFGLFGLFYLAVLLPTLAVAVRRLHDAGFSGLFLLLGLVTGLIPLIMCALPTSPGAVRYGPPGQPYPGAPGPYGPYGGSQALQPGYGPQQPGQPYQPYGQPAPQPYGPDQPYGQPYGQSYGQGQPYGHGQAQNPAYDQNPQAPRAAGPQDPSARD